MDISRVGTQSLSSLYMQNGFSSRQQSNLSSKKITGDTTTFSQEAFNLLFKNSQKSSSTSLDSLFAQSSMIQGNQTSGRTSQSTAPFLSEWGNTANLPGGNEMVKMPDGQVVPAWSSTTIGSEQAPVPAWYIAHEGRPDAKYYKMYEAWKQADLNKPVIGEPEEAKFRRENLYKLPDYLLPFYEKTDHIYGRPVYSEEWLEKSSNYFAQAKRDHKTTGVEINQAILEGNYDLELKVKASFYDKILADPKFLEDVAVTAPTAYKDIMAYKNSK